MDERKILRACINKKFGNFLQAHVQKSVTNDITKRVMDVVNTEFNSPSIFSSPNKDGKENTNTSSSYDSTHSHPDSSSSSITTGPGKDIFDNEYGSDGETLVNKERGNQCTGERNIVDRSNITNSMKHGQVTQNQENHNIVNDKANVNTNATKENISTTKPILNSKNIHQETGMPCITRAIYSSDDKCASNSDLNTKNNSYLVTDSNTNNVMDHHSVSVAENIEVVQPNIRQDIPIDRGNVFDFEYWYRTVATRWLGDAVLLKIACLFAIDRRDCNYLNNWVVSIYLLAFCIINVFWYRIFLRSVNTDV